MCALFGACNALSRTSYKWGTAPSHIGYIGSALYCDSTRQSDSAQGAPQGDKNRVITAGGWAWSNGEVASLWQTLTAVLGIMGDFVCNGTVAGGEYDANYGTVYISVNWELQPHDISQIESALSATNIPWTTTTASAAGATILTAFIIIASIVGGIALIYYGLLCIYYAKWRIEQRRRKPEDLDLLPQSPQSYHAVSASHFK
ncbi:hypothetical protein M427DRAFT_50046 [Gonapodya prolifera JEL478]|uniref:Uncharacterized protein n=1 Tax=Gonapodya prolifera (strain JEL478) TaxID=1344416 RepID=A0A138ZX30_GONPJ|nr:hypothetical protein M427DRAFT_50046 [Gonapodya prolifera JEL478]|eukprot:KXS09056.1 hypothetical protein M427DRAFT_50046 [Gonapodya prolifera JEL478]